MSRARLAAGQIIGWLRKVEVPLDKGSTTGRACNKIGGPERA